ncbi:hypothetical protein AgCh_024025 [Apium graveolens]
MRPGSSAPPKRGWDRPPKVKDANAAEVPVAAVTPPAAPAIAAAAVADGTDEEFWRTRFSQTFVYMVEDLKKGKLGDEEISQLFQQKLRDIEKEHSEDKLKKKNREKALSVLPCEQAAVAQKDSELVIC